MDYFTITQGDERRRTPGLPRSSFTGFSLQSRRGTSLGMAAPAAAQQQGYEERPPDPAHFWGLGMESRHVQGRKQCFHLRLLSCVPSGIRWPQGGEEQVGKVAESGPCHHAPVQCIHRTGQGTARRPGGTPHCLPGAQPTHPQALREPSDCEVSRTVTHESPVLPSTGSSVNDWVLSDHPNWPGQQTA